MSISGPISLLKICVISLSVSISGPISPPKISVINLISVPQWSDQRDQSNQCQSAVISGPVRKPISAALARCPGNGSRDGIRHHEVWDAVAIEIGDGDRSGGRSGEERSSRSEGPVARAGKQYDAGVGRRQQIDVSVAVEVGQGDHGVDARYLVDARPKGFRFLRNW